MKNLKRVLSLALSGIMLVGMMAMSASAVNAEDFTDSDEITHAEAVSIATALKIIDGKEDGSFDPDGFVTRGQMAKMITRAMFGGEDPVLGLPSTPSFSDIKGRWDETYIEYCSNNGIINGRGDGTFDPEGNVTGTEAAKMLLTALGYKADIYGLVGPDWAITTNSIANQTRINLYGGLKGLDPTQPFTRDQVAQMVYNTLNANTREMNPNMEITGNGDITYQYVDSKRTLLYDKYGAVRVEGVVKANEFSDNSDGMKGKTEIEVSNADELREELDLAAATVINANKLAVSSGKDVFERAVIVYVKPSNTNKKDLNKGVVISDVIYDVNTNTEFTTTDDKKMSDWPKDQGIKFDTFGENDDKVAAFYTNYDEVTNKTPSPANYGDVNGSTGATINDKNTRGVELTFIDNDGDGVINAVLRNVWEFGQVTKYSTKDDGSVTVKTGDRGSMPNGDKIAPANAELKDIVAYEDIALDDYVNVTRVHDTFYIEKAETVNGNLDSFENDAEDKDRPLLKTMTVDGETYKVSKIAAYTDDGLKSPENVGVRSALTEEVDIYFDAFGYVVAGNTKVATNWLFVANAAVNNNASSKQGGNLTAFVYFDDGTSGSYSVNKFKAAGTSSYDDNFIDADADAIIGKLFQYTINSKGELILDGAASKTAGDRGTAQTEFTVADGTKGIVYDRERSKLTIDDNGNGVIDSGEDTVQYVTMDTPVFFVSMNSFTGGASKGTIDKVTVYSEKTAPSMIYKTDNKSTVPNQLWKDAGTGFFSCGVSYVTSKDSTYNLDAVVFTSTGAVGSSWVFVIDYLRSVDGGRVYRAIVDGELVEIETTDAVGYARKVNTAYAYSMDGDRFDLDDNPYKSKMVAYGSVGLADRKSVIVRDTATGTEAKMTNNTVVALIDGSSTDLDYTVHKDDIVYMIFNESKEAEGIFILEEYDEGENKSLVYTDYLVEAGKDYTVTADPSKTLSTDYNVAASDATTAGALKDLFITSRDADVKIFKGTTGSIEAGSVVAPTNKPTSATKWSDITGAGAGDAVAPSEVWFLAIKAKNADNDTKSFTVVTIGIEDDRDAAAATVVTLKKAEAADKPVGTLTDTALTAGETETAAATGFVDTTADCVQIVVTGTAGTDYKNLVVKKGGAVIANYASGDAIDLGDTAGEVTLEVTLTALQTGKKPTTYTYTVDVTFEA